MLSTLLILASLSQCDGAIRGASCPSCGPAKAIASQCPETCRCPFPGACGHPGCTCKFTSGWRPRDEWRPFTANPTWEVFGHEVDGVFRYTLRRRAARQAPAAFPNGNCPR